MKRLVEFPLHESGTVIVEVDEAEELEGALVRVARKDDVIVKAGQTFEAAMDTIESVTQVIIAKLKQPLNGPQEIEVEFGIKLSSEAGAIIASTGVEANFSVKLTWKHDHAAGSTPSSPGNIPPPRP